jgi:hypothetical protein
MLFVQKFTFTVTSSAQLFVILLYFRRTGTSTVQYNIHNHVKTTHGTVAL